MRLRPLLAALFWLGLLALLPTCGRPERCSLVPGTQYEGEGIMVLRESVAQDGGLYVDFYPVCHVDTLDLVGTLRQAPEGFLIYAYESNVLKAVRHRSVVLQDRDKRRSGKNPCYYVTSVHLAFACPPKYAKSHRKPFPHVMDTDQGRIEHLVSALNPINHATFYGI